MHPVIIHCTALHGLVDDQCNLRRYNSSSFYNEPYLPPLPPNLHLPHPLLNSSTLYAHCLLSFTLAHSVQCTSVYNTSFSTQTSLTKSISISANAADVDAFASIQMHNVHCTLQVQVPMPRCKWMFESRCKMQVARRKRIV